jgi:excisionase family DNA binding protein
MAKIDKGEKTLLTTFDAADYCYVTPNTIKNWIKTGQMKAYTTPGGHYRIRRRDLEEFVVRHSMATKGQENFREKPILLVVEGNPEALAQMVGYLDGENAQIYTSESGFDAGMKVSELNPDLVFIDTVTESVGWKSIVKTMKDNSLTSAIPIIALTQSADEDSLQAVQAVGASDSMDKPFSKSDLLNVILKWVPRVAAKPE